MCDYSGHAVSSARPVAPVPSRFLPLLPLLFVGSGCAALIYEIVWFQLVQLVIGSSAVSLGVLLGTFMGGMCLGSLLLPRFISVREHPLRIYALLELGIGLFGLLVLFGLRHSAIFTHPFHRRVHWHFAARPFLRRVPVDSHDVHGCDTSRHRPLG